MSSTLVVTLTNEPYLVGAKGLFSSLYHNSNWRGPCLVLTYHMEDTSWFTNHGIEVFQCPELFRSRPGRRENLCPFSKYYLFTDYFKKWDRVLFVDADSYFRGPITKYVNLPGFSAVPQYRPFGIMFNDVKRNMPSKYYKREPCFTTCMFSFETKMINEGVLPDLIGLTYKYSPLVTKLRADEPILNIYFYKNWHPIDGVMPFIGCGIPTALGFENNYMHFPGSILKPWKNPAYKREFGALLEKANDIQFTMS